MKMVGVLCTVMVVYRHSLNHEAFFGRFIEDSFSGWLQYGVVVFTEIAVPVFFIISGFFFLRVSYSLKGAYMNMIKKKRDTLFIPFLLWNVYGLAFAVIRHANLTDGGILGFFVDFMDCRYNVVMWYIRDMLTIMVCVPIYGWIFEMNRQWIYVLVIAVLLWFWKVVDCQWVSSEGLLFFLSGGILQKNSKLLEKKMSKKTIALLTIIWLLLCFERPLWGIGVHKLTIIIGIVVLWQLVDYISEYWKNLLLKVSGMSFFIYASHIYILRGVKVGMARLFPDNMTVSIIVFIILPLVVIPMMYCIGISIKRYAPHFFYTLTGGRG